MQRQRHNQKKINDREDLKETVEQRSRQGHQKSKCEIANKTRQHNAKPDKMRMEQKTRENGAQMYTKQPVHLTLQGKKKRKNARYRERERERDMERGIESERERERDIERGKIINIFLNAEKMTDCREGEEWRGKGEEWGRPEETRKMRRATAAAADLRRCRLTGAMKSEEEKKQPHPPKSAPKGGEIGKN